MSGTRAVAYGRNSFDDPDRETSSVTDQQHFASAYAERHGLLLVGFHDDGGINETTMERPGLQALLVRVQRGEMDALIDGHVDRLGRDQEHLPLMMTIFRLHGAVIHTVAALGRRLGVRVQGNHLGISASASPTRRVTG